jgi:hypothetical protein
MGALSAAVADVTGDGRDDVLATTGYHDPANSFKLYLLVQSPAGTLEAPRRYSSDGGFPSTLYGGQRLATGDLTGDGRPEVALTTGLGLDLYYPRGEGLSAPQLVPDTENAQYVEIADLDQDGSSDIVVSHHDFSAENANEIRVLWNTPSGFQPQVVYRGSRPYQPQIGDLNEDGRNDIVFVASTNSSDIPITALFGQPGRSFSTRVYHHRIDHGYLVIDVADVTGDGADDLIVAEESRLSVYRQVNGGDLHPPTSYFANEHPGALEAADVNGDGRLDVVAAASGGPPTYIWDGVAILLQQPDGTLARAQFEAGPSITGFDSTALAFGQLDHDDKLDIVLADGLSGITFFRQVGTDMQPPTTTITSGPPAETNSSSATFTFEADEPGARFECFGSLDDGGPLRQAFMWTPCASPKHYVGVDCCRGYSLWVRAIDPAGNVGEHAEWVWWTSGYSPPALDGDNFEAPIELPFPAFATNAWNTKATTQPGEPNHAGGVGGHSIWHRWTAPADGEVEFSALSSTIHTAIAAYRGTSLDRLTLVAAAKNRSPDNNFTSSIAFRVARGETYRIAVDSATEAVGYFDLYWIYPLRSIDVPRNDFNREATPLHARPSGTIQGSNVGAMKEFFEPNAAGNPGGSSVWFRWQAPEDGTAVFDTRGSDFDTLLSVYTPKEPNTYRGGLFRHEAANNDAAPGDQTSRVEFFVRGGDSYAIAVDGVERPPGSVEQGSFTLNWRFEPSR